MVQLTERGTKAGVNLHLFIHQTSMADFQKNTERFPDMGKYVAVPALFDDRGQEVRTPVESLMGDGPQTPCVSEANTGVLRRRCTADAHGKKNDP
jgi:hypothetical protein